MGAFNRAYGGYSDPLQVGRELHTFVKGQGECLCSLQLLGGGVVVNLKDPLEFRILTNRVVGAAGRVWDLWCGLHWTIYK